MESVRGGISPGSMIRIGRVVVFKSRSHSQESDSTEGPWMWIIRTDCICTIGRSEFRTLVPRLMANSFVFPNTTDAGYRGQLFVNGWQFGRVYGDLGQSSRYLLLESHVPLSMISIIPELG